MPPVSLQVRLWRPSAPFCACLSSWSKHNFPVQRQETNTHYPATPWTAKGAPASRSLLRVMPLCYLYATAQVLTTEHHVWWVQTKAGARKTNTKGPHNQAGYGPHGEGGTYTKKRNSLGLEEELALFPNYFMELRLLTDYKIITEHYQDPISRALIGKPWSPGTDLDPSFSHQTVSMVIWSQALPSLPGLTSNEETIVCVRQYEVLNMRRARAAPVGFL